MFGKKVPLLSFWDIERNLCSFLFNKLRRVCQSYFLQSRGAFREKLIFSEKVFRNQFRTFSARFLTFCEFILAALSKRLLKGPEDYIQKKFFKKSFCSSILEFERKKIQVMSWCFWQGCQNSNVRVQRNFYRKYNSLKENFFA